MSTLKARVVCDLGAHKDIVHSVCKKKNKIKKDYYLMNSTLASGDTIN